MKRTREHGTIEYSPETPEERIAAIRAVVENKQYAKIDDCMADLYSCSAIIQVYDLLSSENKNKFASKKFSGMAAITFAVLSKQRKE